MLHIITWHNTEEGTHRSACCKKKVLARQSFKFSSAQMDNNLNVKHRRLFTLAAQLKAGKGLTVGATIVEVSQTKTKQKQNSKNVFSGGVWKHVRGVAGGKACPQTGC